MPALQIDNWICIMTTGGTPAPVIARLDLEIGKAFGASRDFAMAFAKQGVDIVHMSPQQLWQILHSETGRFNSLLEHTQLKATAK